MKRVAFPFALACLMVGANLPLHAAPYSSLVVFGDSLSDAGWMADSSGPAGATLRFTNRTGPTYQAGEATGPVAPMMLGGQLGLANDGLTAANAGGNNWAVGGYRTDQILDAITSAGGYLESVGGRADPAALYYLTGGGNDFLQLRVTSEATAQAAAGRLVDSVEALQQAGARTFMVWLLPDVGQTPALAGSGLAALVSQLGASFNEELVLQLASSGANVIPLNVPLMLSEVLANPGQYGLAADQDLIGTCFAGCATPNPVYGLNGSNPDPTKLLFNDGVHPTITGQTLIADYAYSLLAAPWELSLLPEMAHGTLRAHQDQLRSQWQADWEAWQAVGQWRPFITAGGQRQGYDLYGDDADGDGYSLNLGGSYRLDDAWRLGLAAAYYEQDMEVGTADSEYQLNAYLGSLFAQYQANRWWGEVVASIGSLDYDDLSRKFDLGPVTRREQGDTDGDLWSVGGRVGYDIAQQASSPWHLSPFLSADYARVEVDGYAEDGNGSSALSFNDQKRTSKRLGVGLQGLFDLSQHTRLFGEVAMEREYEDDPSDVDMAQKALPTLGYTLEGVTPDDKTWRISLGARHQLSDGLSLRAGYTYRKGDDSDQQGVNLSLAWDL